VGNTAPTLKEMLLKVKDRFNALMPVMLQMGIIEDLLHRRIVVEERGGEVLTVAITPDGMAVSDGADPFCHARMCTTGEQWQKILAGQKTFCAIFRFELRPVRSLVPLKDLSLVERFSSVMQAMVLL
jgi:hypothetical protein